MRLWPYVIAYITNCSFVITAQPGISLCIQCTLSSSRLRFSDIASRSMYGEKIFETSCIRAKREAEAAFCSVFLFFVLARVVYASLLDFLTANHSIRNVRFTFTASLHYSTLPKFSSRPQGTVTMIDL